MGKKMLFYYFFEGIHEYYGVLVFYLEASLMIYNLLAFQRLSAAKINVPEFKFEGHFPKDCQKNSAIN